MPSHRFSRLLPRSFARAAVAVLAFAVAGCEPDSEPVPTAPVRPSAPSFNQGPSSTKNYRLVAAQDGVSGSVSAMIGREGGVLRLGPHTLRVPQGAVSRPTIFTMARQDPSHIHVELTALRIVEGWIKDVGTLGFSVPVVLELSYANTGITVSSSLQTVWVRQDGILVPVPTTVDLSRQVVVATLSHFSGYAIGTE